jgi:hypothetical protein
MLGEVNYLTRVMIFAGGNVRGEPQPLNNTQWVKQAIPLPTDEYSG